MPWLHTLFIVLMLGLLSVAQSQQKEALTCEMSVGDQYRQLTADRLLPEIPAPTWGAQLTALSGQVRKVNTQYTIKRQQAEQAEGSVAELLEQVRRLQAELAQAKATAGELAPPAQAAN